LIKKISDKDQKDWLNFLNSNEKLENKDFGQNNNMFEVTVDFVSEIISCVKDKEKKLISGDPEKVKKVYDTWKFSREIKSLIPNWLLVDTQA